MANFEISSSPSLIDHRNGFCIANSTFYSKRKPLPLLANSSLDVTTFISSQPHRGTTAFIDATTGHRISFSDLWRAVDRVADCLYHDIGIKRGDIVLVLSPNSLSIPIVCFAVMALGAIVTTANPLSTVLEISRQIADSNPTLAFVTPQLAHKLVASAAIPIVLTEDVDESVGPVRVVGILSEMMKKEPSERSIRERVDKDNTAMLRYSSGTTGRSKGVISSHGNSIAHVARYIVEPFEPNQIFLCTVPMVYAMATVALGFTVVILRKFELNEMLEAADKYRVMSLVLAQPVLVAMINDSDRIKAKYNLSSLKTVKSGGAPLSKEVTESLIEKYPTVNIFRGYALTESNSSGASMNSVEESRRYGAIRMLSSGVEGRIVDPDTGRVMGTNQTGELWLKGPAITKGYLRNEEATKETIDSEGWLKTGDLCYIDDDGFLFIVDRLKELIKYKAYQVPPAELEALLLSHPEIIDAAVIPFPNKDVGQFPMAYVVRKTGSFLSEKLITEFVAKQVATYKKIRKVAFVSSLFSSERFIYYAITSRSSTLQALQSKSNLHKKPSHIREAAWYKAKSST